VLCAISMPTPADYRGTGFIGSPHALVLLEAATGLVVLALIFFQRLPPSVRRWRAWPAQTQAIAGVIGGIRIPQLWPRASARVPIRRG